MTVYYEFPMDIIVPKALTNVFLKKKKNIYYLCYCKTEIKVSCNDDIHEIKFGNATAHVTKTCLLTQNANGGSELIMFTFEELSSPENEFWEFPVYEEPNVQKIYKLYVKTIALSFILGAFSGTIIFLQFGVDKWVI